MLKDTETKLNLFHWIFLKEGEKIIALAIPTGNTARGIGFQEFNKKVKRRFTTRKPTWTLSDCDHLAQPQRILGAGDEGSRGGGVRRPSGTVRGVHSGKLKGKYHLQLFLFLQPIVKLHYRALHMALKPVMQDNCPTEFSVVMPVYRPANWGTLYMNSGTCRTTKFNQSEQGSHHATGENYQDFKCQLALNANINTSIRSDPGWNKT